jgi:epoxide hydrolase 4
LDHVQLAQLSNLKAESLHRVLTSSVAEIVDVQSQMRERKLHRQIRAAARDVRAATTLADHKCFSQPRMLRSRTSAMLQIVILRDGNALNCQGDTTVTRRLRPFAILFAFTLIASTVSSRPAAAAELGEDGYVDSHGVKIHYVTMGSGELCVLIHGFPDFWYTWRAQMPELAKHFKVVAIDQRGYNLSDKPEGVDNYRIEKLVGDVNAVVDHFKAPKAIIVGHDWGGMVAWTYAMQFPDKVDRLVILNLPHPRGLMRELANNPAQQKASQYARNFQKPDAASKVMPAMLALWVTDSEAKPKYIEALKRSSMEGMLNYYKANFPRDPAQAMAAEFPKVKCPVLVIHGLKDVALLPAALNGTWDWIDNQLTLVTIPKAGHFVQQDAANVVTKTMVHWLTDSDK